MTAFLLVPGLNCDARMYAGIANVLWQHGPVTVANHFEGATMAEIAGAILAVAPPKFALAGFSMGGYIVFEMLRQAPERVTKLALLDTTARPDTAEATENRRRQIVLAQKGKFIEAFEGTYPKSVHPDNVANEDIYAINRGMAEANGPERYVAHQQAIIGRADSRPDLAKIKVPTLILVGEGDQITPPDAAEEMHKGIAGSRLVTIARAGHMSPVEQPQSVQAAMREWAAA
jgi:pimeloyl-ACP methyl ester carboxylesterase